jgi:cell division protein FtsA
MRGGLVSDIDHTVAAIQTAFMHAYELARAAPAETYVGIAGDHISGLDAVGAVEVANPNVGVDARDCRAAIRRALQLTLPPDQEVLHHVVREFVLNGHRGIHNPLGLFGSRLEANALVITSSIDAGNSLTRCVKRAGLKTTGLVLESLASSLSILSQRERELGVLMVDIGGGTADVAIFHDGTLQHTSELAWGGDNITHDIAAVLRCSPHDAENLKKKFGHANPLAIDAEERVDLRHSFGDGRRVSYRRRALAEIIEARLEEILFAVKRVVERSGHRDRIYAGLVLTGGTALLEGIVEVAERILELPARIGMPQGLRGLGEVVSSPIYSTGVGLVKWAVEEGPGYQRDKWLIRKLKEVFDLYA